MITLSTSSSCEISTFSAPPSAGATVSVDGTLLVPSPFVNLTLEKNISDDIVIGGLLRVELNGTAVGGGFDEVAVTSNTSIKSILELSRNSDCVNVIIKCGENFINGSGKIIRASASEGNQPAWVNMAPYTIEIELYNNNLTGESYVEPENPDTSDDPDTKDLMLKDITEQFNISLDEDSYNFGIVEGCEGVGNECSIGRRHVKVSFSISATGIRGGDSCPPSDVTPSTPPSTKYYGLDAVEQYMIRRLDKLKNMNLDGLKNKPTDLTGVLTEYSSGSSYMDFRSLEVDPRAARMSLQGDIIYRPKDCEPNVFTSINVEENLDTDGNQITVSGSINGLVDVQYTKIIRSATYLDDSSCNFNSQNTKMDHAIAYYNKIKDYEFVKKIALAHKTSTYIDDACDLDPTEVPLPSCFPSTTPELCEFRVISSQVSRNYAEGQIDFSFVLSNKVDGCAIPGVSDLDIDASHDIPRDNIVEILVPGRGSKGPIIQNLCCLSSEKWSFNISMNLKNPGCKIAPTKSIDELRECAKNLLDEFKKKLGPEVDTECWFVTDNQESIGRSSYKYSIQYTKPSCP